jgi:hypothetical protein
MIIDGRRSVREKYILRAWHHLLGHKFIRTLPCGKVPLATLIYVNAEREM